MKKSRFDRLIEKLPRLKSFLQNTVSLTFIFELSKQIFKNKQLQSKLKGLRDTRQTYQEFRIIYLNNIKPSDYTGEEALDYGDNCIVTSKV